ncbi:MAG TPA: hypothetical protein VFI27_18360 [candidate division Zixibacteria bacterium]|nr:hypothetical protein [candidate division Zixibacteria bacterium]
MSAAEHHHDSEILKPKEAKASGVAAILSGRSKHWLIALLAFLVVIAYVGITSTTDEAGFPLDDSWIHLTYARNLARSGQWEFVPGVVSAGSTAPLWTILLAVGYVIGLPYFLWAFFLGWLCLTWSGIAAMRLWSVLWPKRSGLDWVIGLVIVLSWPFVWSAASGMETMLFIALELEIFYLYGLHVRGRGKSTIFLGFVVGLLVLTRPEGLGMLALLSVGMFASGADWVSRLKNLALLIAGSLLTLIPYFAFNLWSSGNIWPNTFYAKQVEYASIYSQPLITRFLRLVYLSMGGPAEGWRGISGAHLLLLPGVIAAGILALRRDWRRKELNLTIPLLWAAGLVFVYAWRLPVTYQHGRYLFPSIPIWILYGISGWLDLTTKIRDRIGSLKRLDFVLTRMAVLTFVALLLIFVILGLQVFAQDVAFVNGEMVAVGRWIRDNTPSDALVAAHDIGAIGYFAERPILDLAGLISPEVIPLLSDRDALMDYVSESQTDYLVTAPGWTYDRLVLGENSTLEFSTDYAWTREQGLNNMEVYLLSK